MMTISMFDFTILCVGVALVVFAFTPMKYKISNELIRLSERNKGVGIMHGMVRRKDRAGVVADRRFSAPSRISE